MDETSSNYPYLNLETKWQNFWDKNKTFKTTQDTSKPKYYALDMFPFPSGEGLHVGHPEGYTATDIMCRYKRMKGFNVLHPMGWDSFGLPAENYAMKTGTHPEITTKKNIATFKRQLKSLGFSYDWEREIATSHPDYFKWTQWIFVQLYNQGLCYEDEINVNWCPNLKTVLANEEVVDGKSEVGGHPVIQKKMNQWMLKITKYAERLLVDLEDLDWPESIKEMQRNWIGKSVGARISFDVDGADGSSIEVFTTRPDTLFGATYLVLAPEHPLVQKITKPSMKSEIDRYTLECQKKNDLERTELNKNKTGVFTGSYAIHPLTKEKIPVWIADYVLTTYGTGAIMSVPAHDTRDHEFALKFHLKIIPVIELPEGESLPYTKDGKHINSQFLNGLNNQAAIKKMLDYLEEKKIGKSETNYKLRDWIFSRQRYWGEPFPILKFEDGTIRLLDEDELPLKLPAMEKFEPSGTGESPLLNADEWLNIIDPKTKKKARRETNTMPNWAGSCWYYLRFIDPRNEDSFVDPTSEKYWMPVDLYVGGAEHAVLHLLYARFWHKVLYDLGFVSTKEPFKKLVNQGLILAEDGEKMSKSRGNVVNPDHIVAEFGGDSLRLYEMFMGPIDKVKPWKTDGVKGVFNFLNRAYRFLTDKEKTNASEDSEETIKLLHKTIKKVTHDYEGMHFNTAISSLMIFLNHLYKVGNITPATAQIFIKLLYPMAPHLGEELYSKFNPTVATITYETWPLYNEALTIDDTVTIAISVNGKLRGTINVNRDISSDEVLALAKKEENIARNLQGLTLVKEIYVPGKIVNFVAKN